jgi:ABC-2 type transport system permease protein
MKLHPVRAVIRRHLYEIRRNLGHLSNILYWPVMNIVVWGFFTIYLRHRGTPGVFASLLAAVILWGLFQSFQPDIGFGFLDELWSRNLINLFGLPLSITEYLAGLLSVNLIKAFIGTILEALIAWLCDHFNIFAMALPFVPFIFNLVLFGLAAGIVTTGLILRCTTKFQVLELWWLADAAIVRVLAFEVAAGLSDACGVDIAHHSCF